MCTRVDGGHAIEEHWRIIIWKKRDNGLKEHFFEHTYYQPRC
jgi:hypothetical protein